jgi:surface polysaccharide O-acyltransferase-like enzyme
LDFVFSFLFFIFGYILYSDDRFLEAIRRDRWFLVGGGVLNLVSFGVLMAVLGDTALEWVQVDTFDVPGSIIGIVLFTLSAWCWALCVLYLAMKHWDSSNRWLAYGNETIMPLYLFHQPVIVVIAFFAVQWDAGIPVKLLVIVFGSLLVTLALVEAIKRIGVLRGLFGMKNRRREAASTETA